MHQPGAPIGPALEIPDLVEQGFLPSGDLQGASHLVTAIQGGQVDQGNGKAPSTAGFVFLSAVNSISSIGLAPR